MRLSDSIALPAFLLFGQIGVLRYGGLPENHTAAQVTVVWTAFLFACLIQAIWLRKRDDKMVRAPIKGRLFQRKSG